MRKSMWFLVTAAMLVLALIVLATMSAVFPSQVTAIGLIGPSYFLFFAIIGLSASAFLFGAMKSKATYSAAISRYRLDLAGPVVLFLLILFAGFKLSPAPGEFMLKVRLQTSLPEHRAALTGELTLYADSYRSVAAVDATGEAIYTDIPPTVLDRLIRFGLHVPGYHLSDTAPIMIPDERVLYLMIKPIPIETLLRGRLVDHAGNGIVDAHISINFGEANAITTTDGNFSCTVPYAPGRTVDIGASQGRLSIYSGTITIPETTGVILRTQEASLH